MRSGVLLCVILCAGCASGPRPGGRSGDGGGVDGGIVDGGITDGGVTDGGITDGGSSDGGTVDGGPADGGTADGGIIDRDHDGLDDRFEIKEAKAYLPWISLDTGEQCGSPDGYVVRVFPNPNDPTRPPRYLEIRYDHLYQVDCGSLGHPGDDENIAITVDTRLPAPQGIMVIKAISHRNTPCQHDSYCVQQKWSASPCSGYATCDKPAAGSARAGYPVVYVSTNKHGDYTTLTGCTYGCDFGACNLDASPDVAPIVNVGEPGHPLVTNLTTQGFINAAHGWTDKTLYDYDPWGGKQFGGAGTVSKDLTDAALDTPICH